ncbi:MAG: Do family serine endopeptidase [Thermoanaerobaculia bacterium]
MSHDRSRQAVTLALVLGAIVFGMILAGALDLTAPGNTSPEPAPQIEGPEYVGGIPSFADLVERVSPAVASIDASTFERTPERRQTDPFEFFFGPRRRDQDSQPEDEEFRSDSGGSGFVISADGLVVTNNHVIRGADQVRVRLGDDTYDAEVIGTDAATDIALLKIEADRQLDYLQLGNSTGLRVGDWVMAIGNPQGLANSVTVGVVSAKGRRINISQETASFEDFIQTDAAINFGNSGGPLVDLTGQVVGINTAINWGSENIGFAVPVNILQQVLPQLKDTGRVRRGFLGIGVNDMTQRAAEAFGLESTDGVIVTEVRPGMPAEKAGVEHGDIILKVDDTPVGNTRELIEYVSAQGPDATVRMEILRDGKRVTKKVELTERPTEGDSSDEDEGPEESGIEWLGLRYQDMTPGLRSMHGLPEDVQGVWISEVSPRSPLYDEGVRAGEIINVITEVNGTEVGDVEQFETIVRGLDSGARMRIYIRRFARGQEIQPLFVFPAIP